MLYPERRALQGPCRRGRIAETGGLDWEAAEERLREIVDEVNQKLLPYQKISKVTVLRERLAETTKKTVKRFAVAKGK